MAYPPSECVSIYNTIYPLPAEHASIIPVVTALKFDKNEAVQQVKALLKSKRQNGT